MSAKKVTIGARPTRAALDPDAWVSGRESPGGSLPSGVQGDSTQTSRENDREGEAPKEPMKRLTIDIPESLHKRVKSGCALSGEKIVDVVREILEQRFPE